MTYRTWLNGGYRKWKFIGGLVAQSVEEFWGSVKGATLGEMG